MAAFFHCYVKKIWSNLHSQRVTKVTRDERPNPVTENHIRENRQKYFLAIIPLGVFCEAENAPYALNEFRPIFLTTYILK